MNNLKLFIRESGVVVATTLGAGVFALPYVFSKSGWLIGVFYLLVFGVVVWVSHVLYWRVLEAVDERERLLGLAKTYLGKLWYYVGIVSVITGLSLTLVIYLILGTQFAGLFLSSSSGVAILLGFWLISILPLFFKERRVLKVELFGVMFMAAIIFLIFFTSQPTVGALTVPDAGFKNLLLPFGAVLFSLAGWTSIEPIYGARRRAGLPRRSPKIALAFGTFFTALLYLMFVSGIFGSAPEITPDTVSGLAGWPPWRLGIVGALGLFALWTSYMSISLEIKNALEHDLRWKPILGLGFVLLIPLVLVLAGFSNFLHVIGLAGGVFLGLQYVIIVLIGQRVLQIRGVKNLFLNFIVAVFLLAAAYEVYYFVV